MSGYQNVAFGLVAALVIGLLIGAERERRKPSTAGMPGSEQAGIRSFAIVALAGAVAEVVGGTPLLAVVTGGVVLFAALAWLQRRDDPGLVSEFALVATALLGGAAIEAPQMAGAVAVIVTVLLASREELHRFTTHVLTERELRHGLLFAVATVVVLPLVPDRPMGPYGSLNLHRVWIVVVLVMGISAAGYVATRVLGSRWGLPVAGLASGFVSSTATIGAMATRVLSDRRVLPGAVAGAVLSTVATVVQMAAVLGATSTPVLRTMILPLLFAGAVAIAYGMVFLRGALVASSDGPEQGGVPFDVRAALLFALTVSVVIMLAAMLRSWFGEAGVLVAVGLAGFADTHSAAVSAAALVASGQLSAPDATFAVLLALSTNTVSKLVVATTVGDRAYAVRVVPGLLLVIAAAWLGYALAPVSA